MRHSRKQPNWDTPTTESPSLHLSGTKASPGPRLQDDVRTPPPLVVNQPPFTTTTDVVSCQQDVPRTQDERFAITSREFECAG